MRIALGLLAAAVIIASCVKPLDGALCEAGACGDSGSGYFCDLASNTCVSSCPAPAEACGRQCVPQGQCAAANDAGQLDAGGGGGGGGGGAGGGGGGGGADAGGGGGPADSGETDAGQTDAGASCGLGGPPLIITPRSTYLPSTANSFLLRFRSDAGTGCLMRLDHGELCANQETDGGSRCLALGGQGLSTDLVQSNPVPVSFTQSSGRRYLQLRACEPVGSQCGPPSLVRVIHVGTTPGDIDGDRKADIVVGSQDSTNQLVEYKSSTGFAAAALPVSGVGIIGSLSGVGDYTGDGLGDAVVVGAVNANSSLPVVLRGTVNGLEKNHDENAGSPNTAAFGIGDINGDGFMDIAIVDLSRTGAPLRVSLGPNALPTDFTATQGMQALSAAALGDVNDDGFDDFALYGYSGTTRFMRIFAGRPDLPRAGTATDQGVPLNVGINAQDFATGVAAISDINGDGITDFVVGHSDTQFGAPFVFRGSAAALVDSNRTEGTESAPMRVTAGGYLQGAQAPIEFIRFTTSGLSSCIQPATGTTTCEAIQNSSGAADWGAVGDVDGDGKDDIGMGGSVAAGFVMKVVSRDASGNLVLQRSTSSAPGGVTEPGKLLMTVPRP